MAPTAVSAPEAEPVPGWVADEVAQEFPELALRWVDGPVRPGAAPPEVRYRLGQLANRVRGQTAIALRQQPVPHAYRVFYRQVGLDPDAERTPVEAAVLARLFHGGFPSRGLVEDALTVAVVETGVPVWALDADRVGAGLGLRLAGDGEPLGDAEPAPAATPGAIVVADERCALAEVFGPVVAAHAVGARTRQVRLFALAVAGVPSVHVEEALWACRSVLDAGA